MKATLQNLLFEALGSLDLANLAIPQSEQIQIEKTRDKKYGDFSSNIAMVLSRQLGKNPGEFARQIINNIPDSDEIEKIEVAGPGFINFYLKQGVYLSIIKDILEQGENFGRSDYGNGSRILIEFVSANPTGPLHIGHGRGAAYGATLTNLLRSTGFTVDCEYYVNDAGRQMEILVLSIWMRYLGLCNAKIEFPAYTYQGEYVNHIAQHLYEEKNKSLYHELDIRSDHDEHDQDRNIDSLIKTAREKLGSENFQYILDLGLQTITGDIRSDLAAFGVEFNNWYSEQKLIDANKVKQSIEELKSGGHIYEKEGAFWFRSSEFGDEKDRVVIRENGQATYFASDIAYHKEKMERDYDTLIDIWGADHHGYIPRIMAAMTALDKDREKLNILLVQFATLYRGKEKVQMSTRSGQYITLKELIEEVGKDATRFFYILRKCEQHLDFDLELAKSQSNDNPVYYIQYAHARICSVFKQLQEKGFDYSMGQTDIDLGLLNEKHENKIVLALSQYPEILHNAATRYEPHLLAYYLRDLAQDFHTYYNEHQFIVDRKELRNARLTLICAVKQVIFNGLTILGISSPEVM